MVVFLIRGEMKNNLFPYLRLVWVEVLMPHLLDSAAALFDRMGRIREVWLGSVCKVWVVPSCASKDSWRAFFCCYPTAVWFPKEREEGRIIP